MDRLIRGCTRTKPFFFFGVLVAVLLAAATLIALQAKLTLLETQEAGRSRQVASLEGQLTSLRAKLTHHLLADGVGDDGGDGVEVKHERFRLDIPAEEGEDQSPVPRKLGSPVKKKKKKRRSQGVPSGATSAESKCIAPWGKDGLLLYPDADAESIDADDRELRLHMVNVFWALISHAKEVRRQLQQGADRAGRFSVVLNMELPPWLCYDAVDECDSASRAPAATSPFPFMVRPNTYATGITLVSFGMCGKPDTRVSIDIFDESIYNPLGMINRGLPEYFKNRLHRGAGGTFVRALKTLIKEYSKPVEHKLDGPAYLASLRALAVIEPYLATSIIHNCSSDKTGVAIGSLYGLPDNGDESTLQPAVQGAPARIIWLIWSDFVREGQMERLKSVRRATAVSELYIQPLCVARHKHNNMIDVESPESVVARIWPHNNMMPGGKGTPPEINLITNFLTVGGESEHARRILDAVATEAARRGIPFAHPGRTAVSLEVSKAKLQPFLREHGLAELSLAEYNRTHPPTRFPVFVKPFKGGGSHGISIVQDRREYETAIKNGGGWGSMLAQEALEGQDVWTVYLTAWKGELVRRECRLYHFEKKGESELPLTKGGSSAVNGMETAWIPCAKSPLSLDHSKRIARESGCHGFCCVNMKERPGLAPGIFDFNARMGGGLLESAGKPTSSAWLDIPIAANDDAAAAARGVQCSSESVLDGRSSLATNSNKRCTPPPLISHFRALLARIKLEADPKN